MKPLAVVDLDDTLIGVRVRGEVRPVHVAYDIAIERLVDICEIAGIPAAPEAVREMMAVVDVEAAKSRGFGPPARFAESLVESYHRLATLANVPALPHLKNTLYDMGMAVWAYEPVAFPGAVEVLEQLRRFYTVRIVTKGPTVQQAAKVRDALGMRWVAHTFIRGFKHTEDWRGILACFQPEELEHGLAIGNALVADVLLPMSLGIGQGVYLSATGDTWAYEQLLQSAKFEPLKAKVQTVPSIAEVLDVLPSHFTSPL